ncbi:MAG: hypothetical protein V7609_1461 [Verrucomicrobiota bacterium]
MVSAKTSIVGNRFLFTGGEWSELGSRDIDGQAERPSERARASQWLSDLKLYDYRNRMYQPELGRFLQPDPKQFAAGDYNLYRYCHNDPINKTDPMGLWGGPFPYGDDITRFFNSLWNAGPRATWDAQSVFGDTTGKLAVSEGQLATKQYGNNPNAGEAVRHEVWQAELTRKFGKAAAKAVGDAHEKRESDQKDSARDQYNNKLGREQGLASKSRSDSVERAKRDWQNGWSARDKSDPRLKEELKKLEQDRKK